jgi:signal transduction histidine kinase
VEIRRTSALDAAGQGLPWFSAALVVVLSSLGIALWLSSTAAAVDESTLQRGADAIEANVEDQIRILELAGTGTRGLVGQSLDEIDLTQLISQIDTSILTALLGVVEYPVGVDGTGPGQFIILDQVRLDFPVPTVELSRAAAVGILEKGEGFISAPVITTDPQRYDYVVGIPVETERGLKLIGVVFRIDRLIGSAVEGAGEGQYAAVVTDPRHDNLVVAISGEPIGAAAVTRSPVGLRGNLELAVYPGPDFPATSSAWIPGLVIGVGIIVALLLVLMAKMAKSRAEELGQRLRLAQELNESKDRFLATVSHELRTPLTVVLGVADELGLRWGDFDESDRQEMLLMITEQAAEAANIVEDLLVAARTDPTRLRLAMEPTPLLPHLEYAITSMPSGTSSRVTTMVSDQALYADTTRLRQILRNLLENAAKYGGPNIEVTSGREGAEVVIVVSDDGSELDPAEIARIFEPYEQSPGSAGSPTGIGIGLYVSRLLARLMGGDLDCVRADGLTRFRLRLPAVVAEPASPPVVAPLAS